MKIKESFGFKNKDRTNITRTNPIHAFFTNKSILPLKYSDSSDHDDILIPSGKLFFFYQYTNLSCQKPQ